MKHLKLFAVLLLAVLLQACSEDNLNTANKARILGTWDSYEMGSSATGFTPGVENLITIVYASGFTFFDDNHFALRTYIEGVWSDGDVAGTYQFVDDETVELLFSSGTPDELRLEVKIDKLTDDVLWISHNYWASESDPNTREHHLKKSE